MSAALLRRADGGHNAVRRPHKRNQSGVIARYARLPATLRAVWEAGGVDGRARITELEPENAELRAANEALTVRVAELEDQLRLALGKIAELDKLLRRNSSTSSKPPSTDSGSAKSARPDNANRMTRRAMRRKQGKQPGAPGQTLSQVADVDVTLTHRPARCGRCDRSLDDAPAVGETVRQVFDVPDPTVIVTEHRSQRCRCACGCETTAEFPAEATAPACYGPTIKAHALYLMCAQHLPRERCALALADLFGDQLTAAPVVHADETSVRSGSKSLWVHVCSTALLTLLHVGRRDKATVEAGPLGDYTGTIVHDRLAMYFNYGNGHVLCNAHILRSLNEVLSNHRHQAWRKRSSN